MTNIDGLKEDQRGYKSPSSDKTPTQFASMDRERVIVGLGGRLVIPAPMRKALDIKEGDVMIVRVEDGELIAVPQQIAIKKVQTYFKQFKKPGESVVDEFIADKRKEAALE